MILFTVILVQYENILFLKKKNIYIPLFIS